MQPIAETHIIYYVEGVIQETIEKSGTAMIDRLKNYIFRINESVDLRPCHGTLGDVYMSVVDDVPEIKKSGNIMDIQMDSYMLPVLYEEDYDVVAKAILDGFYKHDGPVVGDLLTKEMDLKVIDKHFYNDYENLGLISFDISSLKVVEDDGAVHNLRVMPGEILINKNLTSNPAVRNSTIIHECVHMYLDRHFFFLQRMGGVKFTAYAARKKKNYGWTNSPVDWMELQADKLPAHILMEKEKTTKAIERLMAAHGGKRDFETIRAVIKDLTEEFQVSYSMARNRMVELGYPEAEGTCNYLDGKPVSDHGCSGEWKRGMYWYKGSVTFHRDSDLVKMYPYVDAPDNVDKKYTIPYSGDHMYFAVGSVAKRSGGTGNEGMGTRIALIIPVLFLSDDVSESYKEEYVGVNAVNKKWGFATSWVWHPSSASDNLAGDEAAFKVPASGEKNAETMRAIFLHAYAYNCFLDRGQAEGDAVMENSNFADSSTMTTALHVNQIYDFFYNSKSQIQNREIWKRIFDTEEEPTE